MTHAIPDGETPADSRRPADVSSNPSAGIHESAGENDFAQIHSDDCAKALELAGELWPLVPFAAAHLHRKEKRERPFERSREMDELKDVPISRAVAHRERDHQPPSS